MGDGRMAQIKTKGNSLYFYTHWSGCTLPADAQAALDAALPRKGDDPYALRRIVDHLIESSGSRDSEVGSGLMFSPDCEDSYGGDGKASVIIDLDEWRVYSINNQSDTLNLPPSVVSILPH